MSTADGKAKVFNTVGSYTSMNKEGALPPKTNVMTSVNNKGETIPFMLDALKVVAGTEALKALTGQMLTKLVGSVEPQLKTALKKQMIQGNADKPLPTSFTNNGTTMKVKDIDATGKFKVAPNSDAGSLMYNTSGPNFDSAAHSAIQNAGTDTPYNNMTINYNAGTDSFKIKPKPGSASIGKFMTTYIDNTPLINQKEIVNNVMDKIYGSTTAKLGKTQEQVYAELQDSKVLENLLDGVDSFDLTPEELAELQRKAEELVNGLLNYDMGCGMLQASLSFDDMKNLIGQISGSTDPFAVGNALEASIDQSTANNPETSAANKETIKDGFFQKIIKTFAVKLVEAVTTAPQVRMLLTLMAGFTGAVINAKAYLKSIKVCVKCMIKEILILIGEFIFALVVLYMIKLIKPVIKKIVKEKINQFVKMIKSLTHTNKVKVTTG